MGVAILTRRRAPYDELLQGFPDLVAATAARRRRPRRAAPGRCGSGRRRAAGRVLLVGDAAGYVDALTGEGIAVGLAAAQSLVDCVRADEPERYEKEWLRASRRYRWITHGLLFARAARPRRQTDRAGCRPTALACSALAVNQLAR